MTHTCTGHRYAGQYERVFETTTAGVTIQAPQLDINTVAAGGGSCLQFVSGLFRVGPESSSAFPGPTCYRRGGFFFIHALPHRYAYELEHTRAHTNTIRPLWPSRHSPVTGEKPLARKHVHVYAYTREHTYAHTHTHSSCLDFPGLV